MITLKIKIKKEAVTYKEDVYVSDDFVICTNDHNFVAKIDEVVKRSQIDEPDEVTVSVKLEV